MIENPIISKGIHIPWGDTDEYIEIDLSENCISPISSTIEWWPKEERWVKYVTTSNLHKTSENLLEICVVYDPKKNQHLAEDDIDWGRYIIKIEMETKTGTAEWIDATDADECEIVTWNLIDVPLVGSIVKVKESVARIQRNQAKFRAALLALDECCTITGERTKEALDAAHIIPASSGGAEVIENGILLRADIHRLYDANLFIINEIGEINICGEITEGYKNLLQDCKIDATSRRRVQLALRHVSQNYYA